MSCYIDRISAPPTTLTESEQKMILRVTGEHRRGYRDHVIIALALGTGLREHEITALDVSDIQDSHGGLRTTVRLRVFKRSNEDLGLQQVMLNETLRAKLRYYLGWKDRHGQSTSPDAPLFVSRRGNRLSTRQMRTLFTRWQERAGFERKYTFHSLRHSAITSIYRRTKDIRLTQRFARHKSIMSTQIYTHPSVEAVLRAVQDLLC